MRHHLNIHRSLRLDPPIGFRYEALSSVVTKIVVRDGVEVHESVITSQVCSQPTSSLQSPSVADLPIIL